MLAASAAFRAAGNPTVAANVVGSMLTRWHYIALAAPLLLLVLGRSYPRWVHVLLFAAVLLAAAQIFVDLRIRAIRNAAPIPISDLDPTDPVRRRFGALHGISMLLLLLQAVTSAGVVLSRTQPKEEPLAMSEDPTLYKVVRNEEEQYSLWPANRDLPPGWSDTGFEGPKEECLRHIEEIWTDMRPRHLQADGGGTDTTGGGP